MAEIERSQGMPIIGTDLEHSERRANNLHIAPSHVGYDGYYHYIQVVCILGIHVCR